MSENIPTIKNTEIESSLEKVKDSISDSCSLCMELSEDVEQETQSLDNLEARIAVLLGKERDQLPVQGIQIDDEKYRGEVAQHDLKSVDYDIIVSCVAGGIAVLVDFLVVKIPKSTKIVRERKLISQQGSPMTEVLRKIGFTSSGKCSEWIKTLENYFGVSFDKSIIAGEKGFTPRSHRIYSLAHDPSPSGFLWALKDAITGTTSYISKDGVLKSVPTKKMSTWKIIATPIIWIGHIISDIFTKAGIPIPGSCLLRTLQFGSFGQKRRTIGEVIEYMYLEGYDLRHFATMAIENAVIELIIRIYHILTKPRIEQFARPQALIQADKEIIDRRLQKMRLYSYAIASAGNIAKLAVYKWNPTALNLPVWTEFLRTSIKEYERRHSTTQIVLDAIEQRKIINDRFDAIEAKLNDV